MTKFAAASIRSIHRDEGRYCLPLQDSVKNEVLCLCDALKGIPEGYKLEKRSKRRRELLSNVCDDQVHSLPPEVMRAVLQLQKFFFAAVTDSVKESQDSRYKCPVLSYIACFAYNEDDTFKLAPQVTTLLAQWQFLLRCTALYSAHLSYECGGVQSVTRWVFPEVL